VVSDLLRGGRDAELRRSGVRHGLFSWFCGELPRSWPVAGCLRVWHHDKRNVAPFKIRSGVPLVKLSDFDLSD
jgi:hypothetical protein